MITSKNRKDMPLEKIPDSLTFYQEPPAAIIGAELWKTTIKKCLTIAIIFLFPFIATAQSEYHQITLPWDNNVRKDWSKSLLKKIEDNFQVFDSTQDIETFKPDYNSLSKAKKLAVWGTFFVVLAKFESRWNPKAATVDVGDPKNKNTWSVGLFQVSVVDQKSFKLTTNYTYDELLMPLPNIDLAVEIFIRQLKKTHLITLDKGVYWAPLKINGRYTKIKEIADEVQQFTRN